MSDECVWTVTGQRIAMVPSALLDAYDEPFRLAEEGEPMSPALIEDTLCLVHEETDFAWRRVLVDNLGATAEAVAMGCPGGCHCRCHEEEAVA